MQQSEAHLTTCWLLVCPSALQASIVRGENFFLKRRSVYFAIWIIIRTFALSLFGGLLCCVSIRSKGPSKYVKMKTIYDKFDKSLIASLPRVVFPGRIIVILTPGEAVRAVDYLLTHSILGIDTETRPSFRRGQTHQVSLLQVSTADTCFLFRLQHTGMEPAVVRLLEDTTVLKVGLSLHDDLLVLSKRHPFKAGRFVDLQQMVGQLGVQDMSLQKLYANFFGERISKSMRLSNWDQDVLSDAQKMYAAIDAWACIRLYEEISRLAERHDYRLVEADSQTSK